MLREGDADRISDIFGKKQELIRAADSVLAQFDPEFLAFSAYLSKKVSIYEATRFDWIRNRDVAISKFRFTENVPDLLRNIRLLQGQVIAATACLNTSRALFHADIVIVQAYKILYNELIDLFLLANEAMTRMLGDWIFLILRVVL